MSGHTPTPWSIIETPHATGTRKHVVNARRVGIATLEASTNKATTEANARLIAASPDLLEALKEASQLSLDELFAWQRKALTLIAKAEGRQ